jgi:hypothetical protein
MASKVPWQRQEPNLPANVSGYICDNNGVSRLNMSRHLPSHGEIRIVDRCKARLTKIKIND